MTIERKISAYLQDYYAQSRNALLVTGARQTGKTFSIRQFGKQFKHFIEINFVDQPQAVQLFANARSSADILLRLSAYTSEPLEPGHTLIFFDEVQLCPQIVTAIKFLVDEGSYRYILSGSLLGVELRDLRSEPVGYMGVKEMFPLDLEEFVRALGVGEQAIGTLRRAWQERAEVDEFVHQKMMEIFRLYLVVGGMPAAVEAYLRTNNLQRVMAVQQEIIAMYKRDIAQYDPQHKLYIQEVFDLIPPELNAKNKRFILKNLNQGAKYGRLENTFLWLQHAGVALAVYNVEEPKAPLLQARSRNLLKLFQSDVGLLAAQYAGGLQLRVIQGDADINHGSVFENAVAQELAAHGFKLYYYNNKKRGEIDFVIEHNGVVTPIEVKSGKDYQSHRALSNVMDCPDYDLPEAIVLSGGNMQARGRVLYAPIYMVMFLLHQAREAVYKIDLGPLAR